ncbi:MAG: LPS assembly lipoprotein LptE [Candidatus Edwardsbacteria bacterium]|jgi:hypothetical protein|nr:LPS assembly lipoprotein LptE [Candidatus Edwardsbacteria bacterium]
MRYAHLALSAAAALALAGCYSFTGGTLAYKTIGVPVAGNTTGEYRATDAVTKAMIAALTADGRVKVIEPQDAESRLELDVTGYRREPHVYDRQEVVSQYRVTITVKAAYRGKADKAVWSADSLSAWAAYQAESETEAAGIEKAASNLAAEILRRAFETW